MGIAVVHWVSTRSKRNACTAAIRSVAGSLTIHDVRGNGQDRSGWDRITVGVVLANHVHENLNDVMSNGVNAVIIITVLREVALSDVIGNKAGLIADNPYLCILDCREGVSNNRKTSDACCKPTMNVLVVESHLDALVAVLIVHVVDCIKSVDINASKPAHHVHILGEDIVVIKVLALNCTVLRTNLLAGLLVTTAIDCVKQAFSKVGTSTKELHLFTNAHGADAASNCVVIAMIDAHKIVVFILDRAGSNRDFCAVALKALWKLGGPQNSQVRLWAGTHVFKGAKPAEGGLGNHRAAINTNTTNGFSDPLRVSREKLIVFRSTSKLDHTKLHNQVVNNLLNL